MEEFETPLYRPPHPAAFGGVQLPSLTILGNVSEGDRRYGGDNQTANQNIVGLVNPAADTDSRGLHERIVGVIGKSNYTVRYEPSLTQRLENRLTAIGADVDPAYEEADAIQENQSQQDSLRETLRLTSLCQDQRLPKAEVVLSSDAHFTTQTLTTKTITYDWND